MSTILIAFSYKTNGEDREAIFEKFQYFRVKQINNFTQKELVCRLKKLVYWEKPISIQL